MLCAGNWRLSERCADLQLIKIIRAPKESVLQSISAFRSGSLPDAARFDIWRVLPVSGDVHNRRNG